MEAEAFLFNCSQRTTDALAGYDQMPAMTGRLCVMHLEGEDMQHVSIKLKGGACRGQGFAAMIACGQRDAE
jgi:hypothetical protein